MAAQTLANVTGLGSWTHAIEVAALADIACTLGDLGMATRVFDLLLPWDGQFLQVSLVLDWGPVRLYLGKLESLLGRHAEAIAHLESAVIASKEAALTIWEVLSEAELSLALRARGSGEDDGRAGQLADRALARAQSLGLRRVERVLARAD